MSHAFNNPQYLIGPAEWIGIGNRHGAGFIRAYEVGLGYAGLSRDIVPGSNPRIGSRLLDQIREIPAVGESLAAALTSECFQGLAAAGIIVGGSMIVIATAGPLGAGFVQSYLAGYGVGSTVVAAGGAYYTVIASNPRAAFAGQPQPPIGGFVWEHKFDVFACAP